MMKRQQSPFGQGLGLELPQRAWLQVAMSHERERKGVFSFLTREPGRGVDHSF
ncbi:MAG: hypothetical protein WD851_12190 [Pirellulales bacterium]